MTTFELPLTTDHERYLERLNLEDVNYILRIRYNKRMQDWYVDIFDTNQNALVRGRRAVLDWELLSQHKHRGTPPGFMSFFDSNRTQTSATRNDLGTRVLLLYTDSVDVLSLSQDEIDDLFGL